MVASPNGYPHYKFIDLFCGIGGFRVAGDSMGWECLFSCDIDAEAQKAYAANFGDMPHGDITKISADQIPDHDILLAGFPCQPFSIIGDQKGFKDIRGTLFFEIARIVAAKTPRALVLENVKQLVSHNKGRTLRRILEVLKELGYTADYQVLNALDFGLPHKRERVFIVAVRGEKFPFRFPKSKVTMRPLSEILETDVPEKFFASPQIQQQRKAKHTSLYSPAIWHENKGGNVSSHPFSCALRAGASYNYLLVDGIRRLTPREMLRLQGFPDTYKVVCNDYQTRKQAGNSVPVPIVRAVLTEVEYALQELDSIYAHDARTQSAQGKLFNDRAKTKVTHRIKDQSAIPVG